MNNKNIGELLNVGTAILKECGISTSRLDAELLLGKVLNKEKIYLITHREEKIDETNEKIYMELVNKRKEKMPVKYILNECEFMNMNFYVEPGVLIPRADTEILVEEVLKYIDENNSKNICDLCCGSGVIGVALANLRKDINVDLIDYYESPEKVTLINIEKFNVSDRASFIKSDLLNKSINEAKIYDIIVSNPPYIEECEINDLMEDVKNYEPHTALSGGKDGLDFYKRIINESISVLNKSGILAFEIGYNQGTDVKGLMEEKNFIEVKIIKDLAGLDRVVLGKYYK
ncbi:peptide chain release factor N(5)-glutamine methyltransferase [Clostridium botulinum]|nr:peptide chain release factor N(5)-glutamine methyltransferase [Clostridium botulinum]